MLSKADYEEVLQMRREFAVLRADWQRTIVDYYARKYNPNQPRVPAGSREGGQWAPDGTGRSANPLESFAAAAKRGQSIRYCMAQYAIDSLLCSTVAPASRRAVCRGQAAERLAACLSGRPFPPLSY